MQVCIVVISDTSGYSKQSHMSPHVWRKSSLPSTPKSKPRKDEIAMSKLADMAMPSKNCTMRLPLLMMWPTGCLVNQ